MANAELAKKIVAVMKECRRVEKNGFNNNQNYKYATSADVIAMVNEALTNNNIATLADTEILQIENIEGKKNNLVRVKITVTLLDADSGEERTISGIGEGYDSLDKATAKAQTQALKYAYMSAFAIAQGDDPDSDNAESYFAPADTPPCSPNYSNTQGQGWKGDGKEIVGQCADCGRNVNAKSAYYSKKNFGGLILCYDCQQDRKKAAENY